MALQVSKGVDSHITHWASRLSYLQFFYNAPLQKLSNDKRSERDSPEKTEMSWGSERTRSKCNTVKPVARPIILTEAKCTRNNIIWRSPKARGSSRSRDTGEYLKLLHPPANIRAFEIKGGMFPRLPHYYVATALSVEILLQMAAARSAERSFNKDHNKGSTPCIGTMFYQGSPSPRDDLQIGEGQVA